MEQGLSAVISKKPIAFLDRDGVINIPTGKPHTYITKWDDFTFLPDVDEAISLLNSAGYYVVVVTNQRGVARGKLSENDLRTIHDNMISELLSKGARIDGVFYCPHEGGCDCRKPKDGLLRQAISQFPFQKEGSFLVGDSESDIQAGKAFGVRTVYVGENPQQLTVSPDEIKNSLLDAVLSELEGDR